ncbi:hypothetical protein CDD82_5608 [Ophiocordyceps australis]|uniref:Uncharacterized protein n=1 Tax=Ophiocordyceps australis TaxID=1399860 RepID=A0A2C5Z0Q4_9HYPO|nr:hypothetical protein CDD82_5608 [Ophiocordyceps australis]
MASLPSKRPRLSLKIKTTGLTNDAAPTALAPSHMAPGHHGRAATPHLASSYPDTPLTASLPCPRSHAGVMTATPPLSAETDEPPAVASAFACCSEHLSRRQTNLEARSHDTPTAQAHASSDSEPAADARCSLPYTHPHSLHSILRNSPLFCTTPSTASSRRHHHHHLLHQQHQHSLHQRTCKRVEYDSPLTQEITTNTYTKSHIDLLVEDMSSPNSPPSPQAAPWANGVQDAGQTPGPFDSLHRTTASRKRKRLVDKRRHWVWTIEPDNDDDAHDGPSNAQPPCSSHINQLDPISPSLPLPAATSP